MTVVVAAVATGLNGPGKHPPLPPLKPKFEVDDVPETLLRVRSKDSDLARLASHESFGGSVEDAVGAAPPPSAVSSGVSFSMKKRVRSRILLKPSSRLACLRRFPSLTLSPSSNTIRKSLEAVHPTSGFASLCLRTNETGWLSSTQSTSHIPSTLITLR